MAKKRPPSPFRLFEGKKYNDQHVRLTKDMLYNKNYMSLSYSSKTLYTYMKLWAGGRSEVDYAWSIGKNIIKSSSTFDSSKKELVEKGFIKCIRTSKCSRMPNRYEFVSDWINK